MRPLVGSGSPSKDKLRSFRLLFVLTLYVGTFANDAILYSVVARSTQSAETLGSRGDTSAILAPISPREESCVHRLFSVALHVSKLQAIPSMSLAPSRC